jgi:hypothetical protein
MPKEGEVPKSAQMTIRIFYPNPVCGPSTLWAGIEYISQLYKATYIEKWDPIYHEIVFIDDKGKRHSILGLACHLEETMEDSGGIDGQV